MKLGVVVIALVVHLVTQCSASLPPQVSILGVFETREMKNTFINAVQQINSNRTILPNTKLKPIVELIDNQNSFETSKNVCRHLDDGIMAIFGPGAGPSSSYVRSLAKTFEIPHFETHLDHADTLPLMTINVHPHPKYLAQAFVDFIVAAKWKSLAIIYEEDEGLIRLKDLLKGHFTMQWNIQIAVRQLGTSENPQTVFKELKKAGETHIVLDCHVNRITKLFNDALSVGMLTHYQHYLITSLDINTLDTHYFYSTRSNISAFEIVNGEATGVKSLNQPSKDQFRVYNPREKQLPAEVSLISDAVHLFAKVLSELGERNTVTVEQFHCNDTSRKYLYGNPLYGKHELEELQNKSRSNFILRLVELNERTFKKTGNWTPSTRMTFTEINSEELRKKLSQQLNSTTLTVVTRIGKPYCSLKEPPSQYSANDRYEGFVIDLIEAIANIKHFNYTIYAVADNKHGSKEKGVWNGLMQELIEQRADVAIGDLTITSEREGAVDFTMPYMNLGISILIKKRAKSPDLFSFLLPMDIDVWLYMGTGYLGVSLVLFVLARFSPYDWENPHPCDPDPDELENKFSLLNSMWFTIGSLMQQGSDLAPKAVSTRLVAGIWWFFTLIMISSYTANLAAFLTLDRIPFPIDNVEDLARQTEIKYGCMQGGTTCKFFNESKSDTLKDISDTMASDPSLYVADNDEGVKRVLNEKYAYFIESSANEYFRNKHCELMSIGELLDSKSYGFATPEGSSYVFGLSEAILELQEKGKLLRIKDDWIKKRYGANCDSAANTGGAATNALDLENVGGVFVVLLGGLGLACVVGVLEFVLTARRMAKEERDSVANQLSKELKFALRFKESKKPVKKKCEASENGLMMGSIGGGGY